MPAIYNQHLFTRSNSILFETHGIGRKIHYTCGSKNTLLTKVVININLHQDNVEPNLSLLLNASPNT